MKKATLIALGAFAALLVLVLATRESQVSVGVRKLELPKLDKARVTALELSGARNVHVRKEADGWKVMDPAKPDTKYVAEESLVGTTVDALNEARGPDFVSDRAEKLAEYGVDDAKGLKLKVLHDGGPAVELVLGNTAKTGGVYVRKPDSNDVFALRGWLDLTVRKDVKEWRRKQVVSLKVDDLSQLTVRSKDGESVTLKAGANPGEWSLAEGTQTPAGFRFNVGAAQQLAQNLVALQAQDFLDKDDPSTGLGEAHDSVEARLKDGKSVVVHLGKEGSGPVAVRVDGDAQVYQVPQHAAAQLRKRLGSFRDLGLFDFDAQKVTKLKVQTGSNTVVLAKEGGAWKVAEPKKLPEGFELDPSQVEAQLGWLRGLRGTHVIEGKVPEALQAALVEVSVEGGPVHTLRLSGTKELYARSSLDSLTYAVSDSVRTRLAQGLELFKRRPQPGFAGMQGLESLPPEVRKQFEAQLRAAQ